MGKRNDARPDIDEGEDGRVGGHLDPWDQGPEERVIVAIPTVTEV